MLSKSRGECCFTQGQGKKACVKGYMSIATVIHFYYIYLLTYLCDQIPKKINFK